MSEAGAQVNSRRCRESTEQAPGRASRRRRCVSWVRHPGWGGEGANTWTGALGHPHPKARLISMATTPMHPWVEGLCCLHLEAKVLGRMWVNCRVWGTLSLWTHYYLGNEANSTETKPTEVGGMLESSGPTVLKMSKLRPRELNLSYPEVLS